MRLLCSGGRPQNQNDQMKNILQLSVMSTEGKRTNGNEAWKRKIAHQQEAAQLSDSEGVSLIITMFLNGTWSCRSGKKDF